MHLHGLCKNYQKWMQRQVMSSVLLNREAFCQARVMIKDYLIVAYLTTIAAWPVTLTLIGISAGEAFFTRYWGWALSSSFCSCWWPSLRGSLNAICKTIPPHENAHILFIGRSDVFWLCMAEVVCSASKYLYLLGIILRGCALL